jgi:hypothetical protein
MNGLNHTESATRVRRSLGIPFFFFLFFFFAVFQAFPVSIISAGAGIQVE